MLHLATRVKSASRHCIEHMPSFQTTCCHLFAVSYSRSHKKRQIIKCTTPTLLQTIQRKTHNQNPEDSKMHVNCTISCTWQQERISPLHLEESHIEVKHAIDQFQTRQRLLISNATRFDAIPPKEDGRTRRNLHTPCRNVSKKHTFRRTQPGNKNMSGHCIEHVMYEDFPNTQTLHLPNKPWYFQNVDPPATTFWRHRRPLARNVQTNQCVRKCQEIKLIWSKSRTRIVQ